MRICNPSRSEVGVAKQSSKLVVHTARLTYGGPDRFDITYKSGGPRGRIFAPSGKLLGFGKRMHAEAERRRQLALEARSTHEQQRMLTEAEQFADWSWLSYRSRYEEAMRISYGNFRDVWNELLSQDRAVLVCYCVNAERCHRRVLANILSKLGATDRGELAPEEQRRLPMQRPVSGTLFGATVEE